MGPRAARFAVPAVLLLTSLAFNPSSLEAQLRLGSHVVRATEAFGGAYGVGLRAGIDVPVLPFDLMASGEYFFPDCPPEESDCGLHGATVDANFRLVFPIVRPYISAGLAYRNLSPPALGVDESVAGLTVGLGLDVAIAGVRAFGESRYEFVDAPEKQFIWRLGVLFQIF